MCIKNIFYNVYADGEEDVTERVDKCRPGSDHICADTTVREYDRRFHCSKQQLSASPGAKTPLEVTVSIKNKPLGSQRVPIPIPKAPRADSRTSVAIPIHSTPENYIFHSYSAGQADRGPPETTMETPAMPGARSQDAPHARVPGPPSQPGISSEGSNKSEMLGQAEQVFDDNMLDYSNLLQHDDELVRRIKQREAKLKDYRGKQTMAPAVTLRQALGETEIEQEARQQDKPHGGKERGEGFLWVFHEESSNRMGAMQEVIRKNDRLVRMANSVFESPVSTLQRLSDGQVGGISDAGLKQSTASPFNNKLAIKTDEIPVEFESEVHSGYRLRPHDTKIIAPPNSPTTLEPNIEPRSGVSVVGISEADDTSSIQSYKDSIFDDLESVMSSASSLGDNAHAVFVSAFVDLLIRDPTVDRMISRATSDEGIGVERFRRSFSRILKAYSRDLRDAIAQNEQQKEHDHQHVVAFISRKALQASSLVAARYEERAPRPDKSVVGRVERYLEGLESDNSDSSDEEEAVTEPAVSGLENFLLQGKPFRALKWHLRSLIISNQRVAQVKESAENLLGFLFCSLRLEDAFAEAHRRVPDFSTWLRLKIDDLAASLETELKAESPMTEYLNIYSDYLSVQAVQRLIQTPNVSGTQNPEPSYRQAPGKMYTAEIEPPEEILEDIIATRLPDVFGGEFFEPNAWAGLSSTKSFREFASELSDAAYPTFFSESRKALKAELDSEYRGLSDQSEERYLLSMLMELECSARQDREISLSIQTSDSVLWPDRLKLFIEKSSGSEWNWWPLSPPPRAELPAHVKLEPHALQQRLLKEAMLLLPTWLILSLMFLPFMLFDDIMTLELFDNILTQEDILIQTRGSLRRQIAIPPVAFYICLSPIYFIVVVHMVSYATRFTRQYMLPRACSRSIRSLDEDADCAKVISWLCKCGCTRQELVSPKFANLFQRLASEYPMAHCNSDPIQPIGLYAPRSLCTNPSGSSSSSTDTPSVIGSDSTGGGSSRASVSTAPSSTGSTTITVDFDRQTFVHLLVRKGDQYVLSPMKVTEGDARGFFQDLIVRYQRQRGFLRQFLSIFVYSHCDFVKVKHHRAYRFSPIPGFSFPERGKDVEFHEYSYSPQPMIQAPITKHMFNDYFYSCYNNNNIRHSVLHKFLSSCDVIETLPQDLLESMPKRDREVMVGAQFGRVEHFWGIVAREQRSALRVVLYMLLSLMPTVWFMFMWMFSWGHEGDLQNATVPVTISLATLSMIWIVVYSGGESGNE
ncbi:hypothetical protein KVR01_011881 [Diaporthe batatas]|uniref:uncharacterized protein n=1 Tax=Diaporthe batatas TaxID=748121 RepID=UPI001D045632|nr:uncharacterized protein KVR01_011881 [Diaporthe batatas]KAG8158120.1 hypothetical protein KVR01_011881 [Diaporthe batatas]